MNKLLAFLLGLVLLCTASPIKREANPENCSPAAKVNCAVHVVNKLEQDRHNVSMRANYNFSLGHKVLCYVFDQYNEHTEQPPNIAQSSCQQIKGYQTNQTLIWKSLQTTCKWVQLNDTQLNCTLAEIKETCAEYRQYEVALMMHNEFGPYFRNISCVKTYPRPILPELYPNISGIPSSPNIAIACNTHLAI